jgi:pyruvate-ferredoxin/flavodoxin oxidoreductase
MLEGFIDGLNSRRPALFNCYTPCQPEHGIPDDASMAHSKMAVESRAYPLFRFDPDAGITFADCISLEGNPYPQMLWPDYPLRYVDEVGLEQEMTLPWTFADFALTEGRFRKHFRQAPQGSWNDSMVPLHEFIELPTAERTDRYPYIWSVDAKNRLNRVMVAEPLVRATEDRRNFWYQLKSLAPEQASAGSKDELVAQIRQEMAQKLAANLMSLVIDGESTPVLELSVAEPAASEIRSSPQGDFEPAWIDTPECDACEECIMINPNIFRFNADKQAEVINPQGGPFRDIVKAAEKCTVSCIHPGTPSDPEEPDLEKLIQRAEAFQ